MSYEKANKALRDWLKRNLPVQSFVGTVQSVDSSTYTCVVQPVDGGAIYNGVRLKPTIDNNSAGFIPIPSVNSFVIVGILQNNTSSAFVMQCSNIASYQIVTDNGATFLLKSDGTIELDGNGNGGLVKVNDLTTKLNNLVTQLSIELGKIATGITGVGGAYTPSDPSSFTASDYANANVKH